MRAIELADVSRAYGERVALANVTLALEEGETLAVFGANGAGKTTLLRILATLLRPHHGTARVLGHDVRKEGWAVRGKLGFLGHEPLLYRDLTARENLRFHARLHDVPLRPHRRAARRGRDAGASRRPGAHVLARDGPAHRGLPRVAARPRAAAARRAARRPGPGRREPRRAAAERPHPRGDHPRRRLARRRRPRARPAGRPRRAAGAATCPRPTSGRCTHETRGLGADPQGRAARAALAGVRAGDGAVLAVDLRALSLRARRGRGRAGTWRPGSCG